MPLFNPPISTATTLFSSTTTQTIAATVAETTIFGSGIGSLTLPANYLTVGKILRLTIRGLYSTPSLNVGNITVRVKLGGVTLATGTATSLLVGTTNSGFIGTGLITCRTAGPTGTVIIMGQLDYAVGNNVAALSLAINNGTSTSTVDTTSALVFDTTIQWSNNTTGNSVSSLNCALEGLD